MTEVRGQKSEDRRQRAEDRRQITDYRAQMTEDGILKSENLEDGMRPPACRGLRPGGKWELTMQRAESIELEMSAED